MNSLMHGTVKIASLEYFNNAHALMQALENLVALTPENDPIIVTVEIAPQIGWQGETNEKEGTVCLFEETLSDGSKVFNIEVY